MTMQLSEKAINEFQLIYQKEYGVIISREQAIDYGTKLIDLVKFVYGNRVPKLLDRRK